MQRRHGFAIVTSLLVMIVIAGLGAGAVFLTTTNLRIAENTRSAMVAQYNAEAGLDLALVALAQAYRADASLPSLSQLRAQVPAIGGFEITELTLDGLEGIVRVQGLGPSGSAHTTGARFAAVDTQIGATESVDPLMGVGFVTNGDIFLPGNGTFDLSMWAGGTVEATGGRSALGVGRVARAAGSLCRIGRTACLTEEPPPEVGPFSFETGRSQLATEAGPCTLTLDPHVGSYSLAFATDEVICVGPSVHLTVMGDVTNTRILGHASSRVTFQGNAVPATPGGVGVKIAAGRVDLTGGTMRGENTVFAVNSIVLDKNVLSHDRVVRTVLATESDIRLNGGGNRNAYATFWANGNFCFNGTLNRFIGSVMTMNDASVPNPVCGQTEGIRVNGSISEASLPEDIDNPNAPSPTTIHDLDEAGIRVLARRP